MAHPGDIDKPVKRGCNEPMKTNSKLSMMNPCLLATTLIAAVLGGTPLALAQSWPTKQSVRVIVPLSAGSAIDLVARVVFDQVSKQIQQTIVVENRPGASQTIGAAAVA